MSDAAIQVRRWSGPEPPSETAIRNIMSAEGLRPYAWSNGPGDVYGVHHHAYHKVICVVEGSITFGFPEESQRVTLSAGDRLDVPGRVLHDAVVGPRGVTCLEAQR